MQCGTNGIALIKSFEGCRLTAYQDVAGVWTIGWGTAHAFVVEGMTCTQDQADAWLEQDVQSTAAAISRLITTTLTQNQFDALVCFAYNVGVRAFEGSTMLKDINAGDLDSAQAQFQLWDHVGGEMVPGLLRRREAEAELWGQA